MTTHNMQVANRACLRADQFSVLLEAAKAHAQWLDAQIAHSGNNDLEDEWLTLVDVFDALIEGEPPDNLDR